jgi:signal transduction histidine kinase
MKLPSTVLLVEDNAGDARLLREMFDEHGSHDTELTHVECMSEAEKHLSEHTVDIILLDLGLPDAQGLGAIRRAHAAAPDAPLVVLTGLDDAALAVQALQEGAQDYLIKGQIEARGLLRALSYAAERKRVERLKNEFITTVSHELRTPLTSIAASLGLLIGKAAGKLPDPTGRLLSIAHTNCQRLVRLVNDILDIEKMESGHSVFNFRQIEVRSLVEQAIEANRGFAEGHGVRIRLENGCADGDARADSDRLAQVVTNLLSNAIKFSPADSEVVVAVENGKHIVRLSVRDCGSGIPVEFRARIFERFAQADATNTRQKGGTGLGLSIVKQIVDRHGGVVGFADAPGGGTIFHVELPCWEHGASAAVDRRGQLDAMRILLCENDLSTAVALREQLSRGGFATDFAHTARDAMTRVAAIRYRAVLVDLELSDGDGIGLILRLRGVPKYNDTPIIVMSADPDGGREDIRSSEINVLDWLSKPVDFDRLMQLLAKLVVHDASRRPRILLVDDDNFVAQTLREIADVASVDSIEEANRALKADDFDLAVLDIALATGPNVDLLPELRDSKGSAIPLVVLSAQDANLACDAQGQVALIKPHASTAGLVSTVCHRLASRSPPRSKEIA